MIALEVIGISCAIVSPIGFILLLSCSILIFSEQIMPALVY